MRKKGIKRRKFLQSSIVTVLIITSIVACSQKEAKQELDRALNLVEQKQYRDAADQLKTIMNKYPRTEHAAIADSVSSELSLIIANYEESINQANKYYSDKNYDSCVEILNNAARTLPEDSVFVRRRLEEVYVQIFKERIKNGIWLKVDGLTLQTDSSSCPYGTGYVIKIRTNLPDGTACKVSIENPSFFNYETEASVLDGIVELRCMNTGGELFPGGLYTVTFETNFSEMQSAFIKSIIGEKGENLKGQFVAYPSKIYRYDGKIVKYTFAQRVSKPAKVPGVSRELVREWIHRYMTRSWEEYDSKYGYDYYITNAEAIDSIVIHEAANKYGVTPNQANYVYQLLESERIYRNKEGIDYDLIRAWLKGDVPY